jgi:hypothetical protein
MYLKIYTIFKNNDEIAIADSILELFKMRNILDVFNKKAIYYIIRERTGIKTQKITKVINILKKYFNNSMNEYFKK